MIQPNTADHSTEWVMPRGTECAALMVSSDVCADAS